MKHKDSQFGIPDTLFKDTQTNIEALTPATGMVAYATDTNEFGFYNGSEWIWLSESGGEPFQVDIQDYTSGSGNWSKPTGCSVIRVILVGGGGGGGGGRGGASSTARIGGGGGGGGAYVEKTFLADDLDSTVAYVVGEGGAAGVGGTHTVCIISSGETIGFSVNYVTITKRIVVSGTAKSAIEKAEEIAKYLVPDSTTDPDTAFVIGEYAVMATFIDKRPSLIGNTNNIFLADFVARFLVIQGS